MTADPIDIHPTLSIPLGELVLRASRSSGPGGQHVNTSSTRIELTWDIAASNSLDDEVRARLLAVLAPRLGGGSVLRIVALGERSQARNRADAIARFQDIVRRAAAVPRRRRATKPTRASQERRLRDKKARGDLKRDRNRRDD
jgi:ribosome-associated protein